MEFASGALGHLDLTIALRMDFWEGFEIYGEKGSVTALAYLPWFFKSSDAECFSVKDRQYHRSLGEDAHFYKLQLESFADAILHGIRSVRDDGLARLQVARACKMLETSLVTLCTGTRHPTDMWSAYPMNKSRESWRDMCDSLNHAIDSA